MSRSAIDSVRKNVVNYTSAFVWRCFFGRLLRQMTTLSKHLSPGCTHWFLVTATCPSVRCKSCWLSTFVLSSPQICTNNALTCDTREGGGGEGEKFPMTLAPVVFFNFHKIVPNNDPMPAQWAKGTAPRRTSTPSASTRCVSWLGSRTLPSPACTQTPSSPSPSRGARQGRTRSALPAT